jgi:hypothetical protein
MTNALLASYASSLTVLCCRRRLQPVHHVPLLVVPAPQPVTLRGHKLVRLQNISNRIQQQQCSLKLGHQQGSEECEWQGGSPRVPYRCLP